MGLLTFFRKIKMFFVRAFEPSIPFRSRAEIYGCAGEDAFVDIIARILPECKIKRNVIVSSGEGEAEIDCLLLYRSKLFAIEIKRWKGRLCENGDRFVQIKTDRWTGEEHKKYHLSPFKQLRRAVYLLKKQFSSRAWINDLVFFEDTGSVSVLSDNIWFDNYEELADYIRSDGKASYGREAQELFFNAACADLIYYNGVRGRACVIDPSSIRLESGQGIIPSNEIESISIKHHWTYDEVFIVLNSGSIVRVECDNAKIRILIDGIFRSYSLCRIDKIKFGRALS